MRLLSVNVVVWSQVTKMPPVHTFHVIDYCIFGATIVVSLGIGVFFALSGGKQRTTSEYFVGNRQMTIIPVTISLMVSYESSTMMIGTPAEVYVYGIQIVIQLVGFLVGIILSAVFVVPMIYPLKLTSVNEYLHLRFNDYNVRLLGTIIRMITSMGFLGIVLFGPAIALEGVTGLSLWVSIVSVAFASVIYTSIGGFKAVIWTDVFQCVIMYAGIFTVIIKGTLVVGGIDKTWKIAYYNGRVNLFNFDADPTIRHAFWSLFFNGFFWGFNLVFNQTSIQRISSMRTLSDARKVLICVGPGHFVTVSLACVVGIVAYAYYDTQGCDPLASEQIRNPNQIIPYMLMEIFQNTPGLPGLFMASLFSASLSSLSSGLNSISAIFWTDIIKPRTKPMSEQKATIISKISVFVFGGVIVMVAFLMARVGGTLVQIAGSTMSAFTGPIRGLFMFAIFCPWGNATGAIWGTSISVICTFILSIGQMTTKGAVKNQKLPSAPVDSCSVDMFNDVLDNATMTSLNDTLMTTVTYMTTTIMSSETTSGVPEPEGIRRIFMLSYQWFSTVGMVLMIILATVISFCTGYKKPGEVERKYVISFYDSFFPCLPECIRKPLRCGYEYRKNGQDDESESENEPCNCNQTIIVKSDDDDKPSINGDNATGKRATESFKIVDRPSKQSHIAASVGSNIAYCEDDDNEDQIAKKEAKTDNLKSVGKAACDFNDIDKGATEAGPIYFGCERL